jgi:hypothetical protein
MSFLSQIGQLDMFGSNAQLFSQNGSTTDIHIGLACPVCDVPDNFTINSMLISKRENLLYKMAAGAGTIAALYMVWRLITKPPKNRA